MSTTKQIHCLNCLCDSPKHIIQHCDEVSSCQKCGSFISADGTTSLKESSNNIESLVAPLELYHTILVDEKNQNYEFIQDQTEYSSLRKQLIEVLFEAGKRLRQTESTVYLAISYLDVILNTSNYMSKSISSSRYKFIAIVCLNIASKFDALDLNTPLPNELLRASGCSFSYQELIFFEKECLKILNWNLKAVTLINCIDIIRHQGFIFSSDTRDGGINIEVDLEQLLAKARILILYFADLIVKDIEFLRFKPSVQAASCVLATRMCLNLDKPWSSVLSETLCCDNLELLQTSNIINPLIDQNKDLNLVINAKVKENSNVPKASDESISIVNKENQLMIINQKDVQEAYLLLEKKYGYLIEVAQSVCIGLNSSFDPFGQLNKSCVLPRTAEQRISRMENNSDKKKNNREKLEKRMVALNSVAMCFNYNSYTKVNNSGNLHDYHSKEDLNDSRPSKSVKSSEDSLNNFEHNQEFYEDEGEDYSFYENSSGMQIPYNLDEIDLSYIEESLQYQFLYNKNPLTQIRSASMGTDLVSNYKAKISSLLGGNTKGSTPGKENVEDPNNEESPLFDAELCFNENGLACFGIAKEKELNEMYNNHQLQYLKDCNANKNLKIQPYCSGSESDDQLKQTQDKVQRKREKRKEKKKRRKMKQKAEGSKGDN